MKNLRVTLAGTMLLLLAIACKKETATAPDPNTLQKEAQEALASEPITPLDKPIPLPAGSHRGAGRTTAGHIPIIMVHGLGGFGPGEMLATIITGAAQTIFPGILPIAAIRHLLRK